MEAGTDVRHPARPRASPLVGFLPALIAVAAVLILVLAGAALLLSSPLALLAAPAYGWWVQRRFIARQERLLEDRFGDAYRAYCLRVRRWV